MFVCGCFAEMSFGQMGLVGQTLYCYITEYLSEFDVLWHECHSGVSTTWSLVTLSSKVRWEALPFFFGMERNVFIWQISEQTMSDSIHVSRYGDKHVQVMLASWRVVSRLNLYVMLTLYNGDPAETFRLTSHRLWYDISHLCLEIFPHCPGQAQQNCVSSICSGK